MDYKRIILGCGLLVTLYLLLLAWQEDYGQKARSPNSQPDLAVEAVTTISTSSAIPQTPSSNKAEGVPEFIPEVTNQAHSKLNDQLVTDYDRFVTVNTDVLKVTIDKVGGDIISVSLPQYPESIDLPDQPFILSDPANDYAAHTGLIGPSGTDSSLSRPLFSSQLNEYSMDDSGVLSVALDLEQDNGTRIIKIFEFSKSNYLTTITYNVENFTDRDWTGAIYGQIKRDSRQPPRSGGNAMMMQPFVGGATRTEDESYKKLEFDDLEESSFATKQEGGYMAFVQHYFVSAFVPDSSLEHNYQARKLPNQDTYIFGFTSPLWVVPAGAID